LKRKDFSIHKAALLLLVVTTAFSAQAARPGWKKKQVNWRMTGGRQIKAVNYPHYKPVPKMKKQKSGPMKITEEPLPTGPALEVVGSDEESGKPIFAMVINYPPKAGFTPWIAVAATDERLSDIDWDAVPVYSPPGSSDYLANDPQTDYAIGIFDTGASAHVMGYHPAEGMNLSGPYITSYTIEIIGASNSVDARVSYPIGIYINGLQAINQAGLLDDSNMVGQYNVSIAVGQNPVSVPDLPTAVGSPMAAYLAAEFNNDNQIYVTHDGNDFNAPEIRFYNPTDPAIPLYPNVIPLELRPLGALSVQYAPTIDGLEWLPYTPSVIIGALSQSLFFVSSVDLYDAGNIAYDRDRFMLDTGAQVTVVGDRVAARLGFDPASPEFEVEIIDVTGANTIVPGFYIDSLEIPALGQWLKFTNVPVIWLDIASPEGGTLDGIIGMNLFNRFNFVLRGGGFFGTDDPSLEFEAISECMLADIAPAPNGDGVVDTNDLALFADAWLATSNPPAPNWDPNCNIAPYLLPDEIINFLDFSIFADCWRQNTTP